MVEILDPIYFRGVERLLIVGAAILAITFGFLLFSRNFSPTAKQSGISSEEGEFSASSGGTNLAIKRVGPGVFFSLFGMVILIYCILQPYERTTMSPVKRIPGEPMGTGPKLSGETIEKKDGELKNAGTQENHVYEQYALGGLPPEIWAAKVSGGMLSINKAIKYLEIPPKDRTEAEDARSAIVGLSKFRRTLIDQTYGEGSFDKYIEIQGAVPSNTTLPKEEQTKFENIRILLEAN